MQSCLASQRILWYKHVRPKNSELCRVFLLKEIVSVICAGVSLTRQIALTDVFARSAPPHCARLSFITQHSLSPNKKQAVQNASIKGNNGRPCWFELNTWKPITSHISVFVHTVKWGDGFKLKLAGWWPLWAFLRVFPSSSSARVWSWWMVFVFRGWMI